MLSVLGFDIGGANTKAAFVKTETGVIKELRSASKYFPVWKNPKGLYNVLMELVATVKAGEAIDAVGITMTAELSDAYTTKREGVYQILAEVERVFPDAAVFVLNVEGGLLMVEEARAEPLKVAAANWAATGWLVSQLIRNCIVVDIGSTSTSLIPIVDGAVVATGMSDLEKLVNCELLYTGCLRTNVAAIVKAVPVRMGVARVSSELFATSGDIHLILGNITSEEFTGETADGREKTRSNSLARLARVVCADSETLSEEEIVQIAQFVYSRQVELVADCLRQVYERVKQSGKRDFSALVTGLGKRFLASKAAEKVGFKNIADFDDLVPGNVSKASTAVGLAFMVASKLEGGVVKWKQ